MNINDYVNKLWASLLADDVPSDFGNVTYYGLLKDTLLLFKKLNEEWEIKKDGFNEQIDSAVKILNSAIELLNSVDTSVDELNAKYREFVNTVNTEITRFENETNSKIEQLSTSIGETIDEYMNSPEFESKINDKIGEILEGSGFKELIQGIIAETTIEFSKVNISGDNEIIFKNAVARSGSITRYGNKNDNTLKRALYLATSVPIYCIKSDGSLCQAIIINNNNNFIIGNIQTLLNMQSSSRPNLNINNNQQKMAFLSDLINYIDKTNPYIPATSIFKIGQRMAIQSNSGNNIVILGDYNYETCLAVKDINNRPKILTESGNSFDISTKNDVTAEVTKQLNTFIDKIYHVGRIIETIDEEFDPNTIIGHWELYGKGRVTVCVDKDNPKMNEAGMTLGEAEVTLTVDEIPSHSHMQYVTAKTSPTTGVRVDYNEDGASGAFEQGINTGNTGNGQPHNNMQPSITVYRWIRIS